MDNRPRSNDADVAHHVIADQLIDSTYGSGKYQLRVVLLLGGIYALTCPTVQLQPFVTAKLAADESYPAFTSQAIIRCQMMIFLGWALGSLALSRVFDTSGRRMVFALAAFLTASMVASVLAPSTGSVHLYGLALFSAGVGLSSGQFAYVYMCEALPGRLRSSVTAAINVWYSVMLLCCALLGGTVMREVDWRIETLVWFVPLGAVALLGSPYLYESLYFLLAQGHVQQAEAAIAGIAEINLLEPPSTGLQQDGAAVRCADAGNPWGSLRAGDGLWRLGLCAACWSVMIFVYYGLTYSSGNIFEHVYVIMGLFALADLAGYALAHVAVPRLGRREAQYLSFVAAGFSLMLYQVFPQGSVLSVACAVAGRLFLNVCFVTVYLMTVESFSTECRATAVGACNFVARVAGLCAPLLGNVPAGTSCFILMGCCAVAAAATKLLPETDTGPLGASAADVEGAKCSGPRQSIGMYGSGL